jgi:hydroxyacylglutathione hydrolase
VWPTHGAGSFCSAPAGAERTSTVGAEAATNPLLGAPDEETFVRLLLDSLGSYPTYFARLAEVNRGGPLVEGAPGLAPLTPAAVRRLVAEGAVLLDVRPAKAYAAGHIAGSLAIPLRAQFGTWLGWLLEPDVPIVVIRDASQDPADIVWPAIAIGYTRFAGELDGGVAAWTADGGTLRTTRRVRPSEVDTPVVVDVRQAREHASGSLPGAHLIELGELTGRTAAVPDAPVTMVCGRGERATTAASLLERAGRTDISIMSGGPADWARATGVPLTLSR